jgi:hypothetical protein
MKISPRARLVHAGLAIAVAATVGGVVAAESSAKTINPQCTPAALSDLMGYWQHKESQATTHANMQAIYGAGMAAELQRGKLCNIPGFG